MSKMTYASLDDPPFMLFHGDQDSTVPLQQSQIFFDHLNDVGVPVHLIVVKNAGHGFSSTGGELSPTIEEITTILLQFFDLSLK